ncbi:hypothetical protein FACS189493_3340 [Spirochaetia bacterium]|nr:hypothetical protein FACS189493_3340 [Spirochaetia bacterium]
MSVRTREIGTFPHYRPTAMTKEMTPAEVQETVKKFHAHRFEGMTQAEIDALVNTHTAYNVTDMIGHRPKEFYQKLAGQKFTLRFDNNGPAIDFEFRDVHTVIWNDGTGRHEEYYEAFEIDKDIVLLAYLIHDSDPFAGNNFALDLGKNLVTGIFGKFGNGYSVREIGQYIAFGVIDRGDGNYPIARRHGFTRDLVGKSMGWAYTDTIASQHIYATPDSYSWTILTAGNLGFSHSAMGKYIKINDHIYLLTWVEERSAGVQGIVLMNLQTMHDVGTFFGINHEQNFDFVVFGARAFNLGYLDRKDTFD